MKKIICVVLSTVLLLTSSVSVVNADNGNSNGKKAGYSQELKKKFKQYYKDKDKRKELLKQILEERKRDNDDSTPVFIRGDEVQFDVPPVIKEGRLLIPVRAVSESLGADVKWDEDTKTITIKKGQTTIILKLDSKIIIANGAEIEIDVKVQSVNSRTVVPIRYIAELLGMKVDWDDLGCVIIDDDDHYHTPTPTPGVTPTPTPTPTPTSVVKYEAESGVLAGGASVDTNHTGYSGTGFINGFWNQGASVSFIVNAPASANYNVALRYSNATGSDRTLSIYVNGTKVKQTVLGKLNNWDTWAEKTETIGLTQGYNTITYRYDNNDSGNVNIDFIAVPISSGNLTGSSASLTGNVNLSTAGTLDWVHWGLNGVSGINRKYGVTQQISNYTSIGSSSVSWLGDNAVSYSWKGGYPTSTVSSTNTAVYKISGGNGFQITVPADTTQKTLKIYLGAWKAKGKLEAYLSDGSSAAYTEYIESTSGVVTKVVTLNFNASTSGQTLTVKYTIDTSHDFYGNVTLQGAALSQ